MTAAYLHHYHTFPPSYVELLGQSVQFQEAEDTWKKNHRYLLMEHLSQICLELIPVIIPFWSKLFQMHENQEQ